MADQDAAVPSITGGATGGAAAGSPPQDVVSTKPIEFDPSIQLGRTGLKQYGGFLFEEFLHTLRGKEGAKAYREVIDNSPLVGGIMRLLKLTMRQVERWVEPFSEDAQDVERAERLDQAFDDMSVSFPDLMAEIATMLGYGYAPMEVVWKKCDGWTDEDGAGAGRSRYDDGLIMPRKIYLMAQDTLFRWNFDQDGGVRAFVQLAPPDYVMRTIPIEKMLLFRPELEKGNPEGNSLIRSGYFSWVIIKRLVEFEAITGERDAVAVPMAKVPSNVMLPGATSGQKATYAQFKKLVQNLRVDDQMGFVIPSDVWPETKTPMFEVTLLGHTGRAAPFDFGGAITRHEVRLAISMLADVMLLGHDKVGSFALSHDKRALLSDALGAWLDAICAVFSRHLFPRIFAYNGWPMDRMPELKHGSVEDADVDKLGNAILHLAQAGMPMFPDEKLENYIREELGWPNVDREDVTGVDEARASFLAATGGRTGLPQDDHGMPGDVAPAQQSSDATSPTKPPLKQPLKRVSKYRHQPRDRRERYSPRGGDVTSALQLLRDRSRVGRADDVHHGFHVQEDPPYDPRDVTPDAVEHALPVRVRLKDLVATQPSIRRDTTARLMGNPSLVVPGQRALDGTLEDRPVIVRAGGRLYIHDGHKRLASRVLLGYEDALVRAIDFDDEEPHVAGATPPLPANDGHDGGLPANAGQPYRANPATYGIPVDPARALDLAKTPPWVIREEGGKFKVVGKEPPHRVFGTHDTNEEALAQMRALYANVPDARKALDSLHEAVETMFAVRLAEKGDSKEALRLVADGMAEQTKALLAVAARKTPDITVVNEVKTPEITVTNEVRPTPVSVDVAAPSVTVAAPAVQVDVAAPAVTIEQPPKALTMKEVVRDNLDRISGVIERPVREEDLK